LIELYAIKHSQLNVCISMEKRHHDPTQSVRARGFLKHYKHAVIPHVI